MAETRFDDQTAQGRLHPRVRLFLGRLGIRGKLLLALLPPIILILMVSGYTSYKVSEEYIDIALERTVRVHTLAIAHELEQRLEQCREDLLFLALGDMRAQNLRSLLERRLRSGGSPYHELCYLPAGGGRPVLLVRQGDSIAEIPVSEFGKLPRNPFEELKRLDRLKPGTVLPSDITEVVYPEPGFPASNRYARSHVIRFYTLFPGDGDSPPGLLFLSIKASELRDILSWYNSSESPLWAFPRSDELRFSYFLDAEGWILFQSEQPGVGDEEFSTYLARENFAGTLGRKGHEVAFRPNENHLRYWDAFAELKAGKNGLRMVPEEHVGNSVVDSFYFSYAPVRFQIDPNAPPVFYGGVTFVDRSQLPVVAGYKNRDVTLLVTIVAILLISFLIFWFGRILTKPIRALAGSVNSMSTLEDMEEIHLPYSGFDINTLQNSINSIIKRVKRQMVELKAKDEEILNVNKRERASLKREQETLAEVELSRIPEIIGTGLAISDMKVNILKAAQADVDVLVSGETGTGKQLVAEAIHNHSGRSQKPFISINCGALDENLLLDALFGHVKGAFSEAKEDRNGAFVEANQGTLFLDEIQSASAKVQQSLLRAIASRKIKPLGSDKEVEVDVRIIAATNVDIPSLIEQKLFREDLYYRLKVLSIATPALRDQRENIPLLAVYYLNQAQALAGRENLGLSRGALAKLVNYGWPGNVRELVNCITRAAVMAETDVIQPEEIRLENEHPREEGAFSMPAAVAAPQAPASPEPRHREVPAEAPQNTQLNARQKAIWPVIQQRRTVTRKEYQELVGESLPARTAIYDLHDFVKRGLLVKQGKGPSTHYSVVAGK
ncbi:sigma-54-dependent transcriptional regulator [Salidesulfovibrio onnuriiensis]|uniref:sigma-54-dependent transcriptional regulator n=1 Tax=Salidesulfovibrio onnuriiensis TaxID=2583823 RepID=UPI0011CC539D|nr:sigma-54 dependent transcriptional regulator [Salidesulfovibrio onnuriiensis]